MTLIKASFILIHPRGRDLVEKIVRQVAVRIKDAKPAAGLKVLHREVSQKRALAGSAAADNPEVLQQVGREHAKELFVAEPVAFADVKLVVHSPKPAATASLGSRLHMGCDREQATLPVSHETAFTGNAIWVLG
jgi:hypothetical protein